MQSSALNSTYIRHTAPPTAEKGGQGAEAIGPSCGGQTAKIHALRDLFGRSAVIRLIAGNVSDIKAADEVLAGARPLSRLVPD